MGPKPLKRDVLRKPVLDHSAIRKLAITAVFSDDYFFERVVLKGGNALSLALHLGGRTSLDLDFSIESDFENIEEAQFRLRTALERRFAEVGLVVFDFSFASRPVVAREDNPRWGGYVADFKILSLERFREIGADKEARARESLVIGTRNLRKFTIELSKYEYTIGKQTREIDNYDIRVYAPEMIAIEKLRALCQQLPAYELNRTPVARARDFFDIHLIISQTGLVLTSEANLELLRNIFGAKDVPVRLLQLIVDQREFHRSDWDSVRISVGGQVLEDFDHYFDFVVDQIRSIESLWNE
jgi:Nucleotidyl transferase AbiEii toxin, Type IV TA system